MGELERIAKIIKSAHFPDEYQEMKDKLTGLAKVGPLGDVVSTQALIKTTHSFRRPFILPVPSPYSLPLSLVPSLLHPPIKRLQVKHSFHILTMLIVIHNSASEANLLTPTRFREPRTETTRW